MSSLQDKMYNYEAAPPATAWEKIAASLDKELFQNQFSSKLYNLEVAPPATAWEKVAASINTTTEPLTTPIKRLSPFLRYAAAAIFIGGLAYSIIKLSVNTGDKEYSSAMTTVSTDSSIADKNKPADLEKTQTADVNAYADETIAENKTLLARPGWPEKKPTRTITSSVGMINADNRDDTDPNQSQSIYAYADYIPNTTDSYVMLTTPDGHIIRMSKKWSGLLCCVSGEEQDTGCKEQLKKWQEKIATSSLAPSPGNFLDILGLVNSLNENPEL